MYASIDKAIDKVQAQIRKYKKRLQDHHAKGLSIVDMQVNVYKSPKKDTLDEVNEQIEEETLRQIEGEFKPHDIAKVETRSMKTLTYSEAIMKMELSGELFLLFRNEEDLKLRVIYRRNDGDYGVIEPE